MINTANPTISVFSAAALRRRLVDLAGLLHACVHDGASIGFIAPFSEQDAAAFWRQSVLPAVDAGHRVVWAAEADGRLAGSVQLDIGTPPNQPHRAQVLKLLVHPECRRQGIARALMAELEAKADQLGRRLITLDTRTGDTAEPLYLSMGFETVGVIPGYSLDPFADHLDPTTIMYKRL